MTSQYYMGVDVGGSNTRALIADHSGRAVSYSTTGPGNPEVVGYEGLAQALQEVVTQALTNAAISPEQIAGAGFGIAGFDWPSAQREPMTEAIKTLELNAPFEIVNDAIVAMLAGAPDGWGLGVVAGTSCNCWGWDKERRAGRMTGSTQAMGEAAGAEELVAEAVKMIARAWTRRAPPTQLTQAFVELAGAEDAADLLEGLVLGRYFLHAPAAPVIFQVAAEGDSVAQELIVWAGQELGSLAIGVIRQLELEDLEFDIILAGSFFDGSTLVPEIMTKTIKKVAPGARLSRLKIPPVVGGVLLGVEQAGVDPAPLRQALESSVQNLLD